MLYAVIVVIFLVVKVQSVTSGEQCTCQTHLSVWAPTESGQAGFPCSVCLRLAVMICGTLVNTQTDSF